MCIKKSIQSFLISTEFDKEHFPTTKKFLFSAETCVFFSIFLSLHDTLCLFYHLDFFSLFLLRTIHGNVIYRIHVYLKKKQ